MTGRDRRTRRILELADWVLPRAMTADPPRTTTLGPLGGRAEVTVDGRGFVQPTHASWGVDWFIQAGPNWTAPANAERVSQRLAGVSTVETMVHTEIGPITHRVAVGVADGKPVAVVEIENTGGVAIAVAVALRPFAAGAAGRVRTATADTNSILADGEPAVVFEAAPAALTTATGTMGDVFFAMPAADDGTARSESRCRDGAAQAVAVWPLPHTATLRFALPLDGPLASGFARVPRPVDIGRGWSRHLEESFAFDVGDDNVAQGVSAATRALLTGWPDGDAAGWLVALAEAGFAGEGRRLLDELDHVGQAGPTLLALGRWLELGAPLDHFEEALEVLARAAHGVAKQGGAIAATESWAPSALGAAELGARAIDQPDVAERIAEFSVEVRESEPDARLSRLDRAVKAATTTWSWPAASDESCAALISAQRALLVADCGPEVAVLPEVPLAWRGRDLQAMRLRTASGTLSYGVRWHGPRPALLWEFEADADAPFVISAPGLDSSWSSTELQGEALLADPGWPSDGRGLTN